MAKSPPDLAACRARLSDPSWLRADLSLRPGWSSRVTPRSVQLAFRGVHGFSLTAQLIQASTYGREIVGSARSGHVSSHPLGRVLVALYGPRAGANDRKVVNFPRQVLASPAAISHSPGRSNTDKTPAGGRGSRAAAGSPLGGDTSEPEATATWPWGYGVGEPYTLCSRSAGDCRPN